MNPAHTPETLKEEKTAEYLLEKLGDIYAEEDLRDLLEAVAELTAAGQLFTQDVYESYIGEVKERKTVVKALCLHIAHDCNLACKYCFAEEGEYHGRRALMSFGKLEIKCWISLWQIQEREEISRLISLAESR